MINGLKGVSTIKGQAVKHLHKLPIEEWDKEFPENIIVDHDLNTLTFRMGKGQCNWKQIKKVAEMLFENSEGHSQR